MSLYLGVRPRATSQRLHLLVEAIGIYGDDRAPLYLFRSKTAKQQGHRKNLNTINYI